MTDHMTDHMTGSPLIPPLQLITHSLEQPPPSPQVHYTSYRGAYVSQDVHVEPQDMSLSFDRVIYPSQWGSPCGYQTKLAISQ